MIQNPVLEKLSVVIPLFNEEENVLLLVNRIEAALVGKDFEIILVDDGSTDQTRQEIKKLRNSRIVLIELKKNYGQSLALAAGIDYASGGYIVTMDGDLQNDPDDILRMYEKVKNEDWDLVTGIREDRKDALLRTLPSRIANWIIRKS